MLKQDRKRVGASGIHTLLRVTDPRSAKHIRCDTVKIFGCTGALMRYTVFWGFGHSPSIIGKMVENGQGANISEAKEFNVFAEVEA